MSVDYEIFEAAKKNQLKQVEELLDAGIDVNMKDFDNEATALHYACSNGSRQTMELLVKRGANVNATNKRGLTPLHMLVSNRYDPLALWLVGKGANIHIQDKKGRSPRDLAQDFFQKELDDASSGKFKGSSQLEETSSTQPTKVEKTEETALQSVS